MQGKYDALTLPLALNNQALALGANGMEDLYLNEYCVLTVKEE